MVIMRVSRRSLELMDAIAGNMGDGVHGDPGPDGLMEIRVDQETWDHYNGLRAGGEGLADAVERALTEHRGMSN